MASPLDCGPVQPTFASVRCRVAVLAAGVRDAETESLPKRLASALGAAETLAQQAHEPAAAGKKRPAKKRLKKAIAKLAAFGRMPRSRAGKRAIVAPVRASLLGPSKPILVDRKWKCSDLI